MRFHDGGYVHDNASDGPRVDFRRWFGGGGFSTGSLGFLRKKATIARRARRWSLRLRGLPQSPAERGGWLDTFGLPWSRYRSDSAFFRRVCAS